MVKFVTIAVQVVELIVAIEQRTYSSHQRDHSVEVLTQLPLVLIQ